MRSSGAAVGRGNGEGSGGIPKKEITHDAYALIKLDVVVIVFDIVVIVFDAIISVVVVVVVVAYF